MDGGLYLKGKPFNKPQKWRFHSWSKNACIELWKHFDLLEEVFQEYGFDEHPEAIYNMDKKGTI